MIRILIVESHSLVREALQRRLRSAVGLEIVGSTGNYQEAIQHARELAPDIILLETKAPEGLETLQALCESPLNCAVIVLTSYPDSREEDEVTQIGARSYLLKTLDTKALVHEIRTLARSLQEDAPAPPQGKKSPNT